MHRVFSKSPGAKPIIVRFTSCGVQKSSRQTVNHLKAMAILSSAQLIGRYSSPWLANARSIRVVCMSEVLAIPRSCVIYCFILEKVSSFSENQENDAES